MIKAAVFLTVLTVILLAIGMLIAGIEGMTIALIFAVLINIGTFWYSDKIILKMYKAKPLDDKKIEKIVEDLCTEAKLGKPKLYLVPTQIPNAFATGRNEKHAVIAITQGLLDLNTEEIKGVLAHELGHIKNKDMLVSTMAATIAGAISYLAQIGYWMAFAGNNRKNEGSLGGLLLMVIFAPIAALLLRMAISRSREYRADMTGALLTKEPHQLASALKKISHIAKERPLHGNASTAHMWVVNPFPKDWFNDLFSTHPAIEKRIKRLEEFTQWEEEKNE